MQKHQTLSRYYTQMMATDIILVTETESIFPSILIDYDTPIAKSHTHGKMPSSDENVQLS